MGKTYDSVARVTANPLTNLTIPLITSILDCFRRTDLEDLQNYVKRPGLAGASVGAGFALAVSFPGGLAKYMFNHGRIHSDLPINEMSDLFHLGHFNKLNSGGDVFLCILTIAACTIAFKSLGVTIGYNRLKNKYAGDDSDPARAIKAKWSGLVGLSYGFLGDSGRDVTGFFKCLSRSFCSCSDTQSAPDESFTKSIVPQRNVLNAYEQNLLEEEKEAADHHSNPQSQLDEDPPQSLKEYNPPQYQSP